MLSINFFRTLSWYYKRDVVKLVNEKCSGKTLDIGGDHFFKKMIRNKAINYFSLNQRYDNEKYEYDCDIVGDAMNMPLEDNSYDSVICFQVLEHVDDPLKLLTEANRVLKPNGLAIFTVPQTNILHDAPYNYFNFTRHGLQTLFEKAGFSNIYIKPKGGFWLTMANRYFDYCMIWIESTLGVKFDFGYNIYNGKPFLGKILTFFSVIPAGVFFIFNLILSGIFKGKLDMHEDAPIHIITAYGNK